LAGDQPATEPTGGRRGPRHLASSPSRSPRARKQDASPPAPIIPLDDTSALQRMRSGVLLALLLTILGVVAAVTVGVLAVALVTTLKQAVG